MQAGRLFLSLHQLVYGQNGDKSAWSNGDKSKWRQKFIVIENIKTQVKTATAKM